MAIMAGDDKSTSEEKKPGLLEGPPRVINVGLERFAEDLGAQGVAVQHVAWSPPAGGDAHLAALLSKLGT
jgi:hypothetical protein